MRMVEGRRRKVAVLGATGSIGRSVQRVARHLSGEIELVALSANSRGKELAEAAWEFRPEFVCAGEGVEVPELPVGTRLLRGKSGLVEMVERCGADVVLVAIVGTGGLEPALAALGSGKDLAVASKEILVMAGAIVMDAAKRKGARVLPVDSEHNAIFQCLEGAAARGIEGYGEVRRLWLTCSGGPFREWPAEKFDEVTPEQALRHPTWAMGPKITVDSATLFNKGLEMIEAHWLFSMPMEKIEVVVHPQSIVHSLVEFVDGSILAQMSHTDMAFPIQYALTYPRRRPSGLAPLVLAELARLEFLPPRIEDFPALGLAREAGAKGGTLPAVLNAANEVAVSRFLRGEIRFPEIWKIVERVMSRARFVAMPTLEEIFAADHEARLLAEQEC